MPESGDEHRAGGLDLEVAPAGNGVAHAGATQASAPAGAPKRGAKPGTRPKSDYASNAYWRRRSDLIYYQHIDLIVRTVAANAKSLLDVGSGNCPYLEWFDWIPRRVSLDLNFPYSSPNVVGVKGNIHTADLGSAFDVVTCFQVLEHVPDATAFARRLLQLAPLAIVSVPFNWPTDPPVTGHVHDPVDYKKLTGWMGREANYHEVVREPFQDRLAERLIAVYDADPTRRITKEDRERRRLRPSEKPPTLPS